MDHDPLGRLDSGQDSHHRQGSPETNVSPNLLRISEGGDLPVRNEEARVPFPRSLPLVRKRHRQREEEEEQDRVGSPFPGANGLHMTQ